MNVTKDGFKDRQLHIEDYLQMVSAEQKEYAEVSAHQRIAENNDIITDFQTDNLMEQILHKDNLNKAYKKVKSNKGAGGVDGMGVDELLGFLRDNQKQLIQKIRDGKYKPNPVRRVEIPKETKGEFRKLGVPTVVDRVFQQSITQVLSPIYERQFSENSFGFRPNRGAHDALKQCQTNVNDGYVYVVDMDLEKFFDTVCQSKLIEVLSRTIKDGRVISLIHKYLRAGVISKGMFEKTEAGMPQGGPLSPFKTGVAHISKVKYLGYSFYRYKGKCRFRVHPKSVEKMKNKIRELTDRSNGWGNEYRAWKLTQFMRGWVNYFGMADMKRQLQSNDEWLRHRIRAIYWKQWKKIKTKYRKLKELGMDENFIQWHANMRQGVWNCSSNRMVQFALNNAKLREWGYPTFTEFYLKICEN